MELLKPRRLNHGDTIGIFTPSSPAYRWNEELFSNGVRNLENLGFKVKLGFLTENRAAQGYRSGTPQDRADELMELVADDDVNAVVATITDNRLIAQPPTIRAVWKRRTPFRVRRIERE